MKKVFTNKGQGQQSTGGGSYPHWQNNPEEIRKGKEREKTRQVPSQKIKE